MASSSTPRASRILAFLLSVFVATCLWLFVTSNVIELSIETNIDYKNLPKDLIVTSGLAPKVTVRIKGPEKLLRSTLSSSQTWPIDLSDVKEGSTIIPLSPPISGPTVRAYEVVDTIPTRLTITAERLAEKQVPIKIDVEKRTDLQVTSVSATPESVTLRGPASALARIGRQHVTLRLDANDKGQRSTKLIPLDTPGLVNPTPSSILVSYAVSSGRENVARMVRVSVEADRPEEYRVEPAAYRLVVDVPLSRKTDEAYLSQLRASVTPPKLKIGESADAKVSYTLGTDMVLVTPIVTTVTVTRMDPATPSNSLTPKETPPAPNSPNVKASGASPSVDSRKYGSHAQEAKPARTDAGIHQDGGKNRQTRATDADAKRPAH